MDNFLVSHNNTCTGISYAKFVYIKCVHWIYTILNLCIMRLMAFMYNLATSSLSFAILTRVMHYIAIGISRKSAKKTELINIVYNS